MKKLFLTMGLVFAISCVYAQGYVINFSGTGSANGVDSVVAENLTQNKTVRLGGNDLLSLGTTVGIYNHELGKKEALHIFPNPFRESVNAECELFDAGTVNINITDMAGKEILRESRNLDQGRHAFRIDGLSKGIYFVHINSETNSYTGKLISMSSADGIPAVSVINQIKKLPDRSSAGYTKSTSSTIHMPYNTGDLIRITGISGTHRTVYMLQPENNQTVTFNFASCSDADGNGYTTVQIGSQLWMAENLKATKYPDGTAIPSSLMAVCNDDSSTVNQLGYVYTWNALMNNSAVAGSQGACPNGWHVPTVGDYDVLINYLGGAAVAGKKMKSTDGAFWDDTSLADNSSGFNALGAGYKLNYLYFYYKAQAKYWTSTEDGNNGREVQIQSNTAGLFNMWGSSKTALKCSCRCLKD